MSALAATKPPVARLAVLASHPIQYFAPWFRHLAKQLDLQVFYAHRQDADGQAAAGFSVKFDWDVPLTEGYPHRWLKNVSEHPGLGTYGGCDTPEISELVRDGKFDAFLIQGWNRKSFAQAIRACWKHKLPVLMRGDSQLSTRRSSLKSALKYLPYRCFLPRIDAHLYVGQRNLAYLRHYGVSERQLHFSPHFVDNEFFATRAEQARSSGRVEALRKEFDIPPAAFVALFVGKFIPKKRAEDFIRASLTVAQTEPRYHALLVGDGPLRSRLESLAHGNKRLHFAGFRNQSELPACYAVADVLVLPSDGEETWGLVVNEAMACGLPAIVSDAVGCGPDMIETGRTGDTFPVGDSESLALKLSEWMQLDRSGRRVTEQVAAKAKEYSMERATAGLEQAIRAVPRGVKTSRP